MTSAAHFNLGDENTIHHSNIAVGTTGSVYQHTTVHYHQAHLRPLIQPTAAEVEAALRLLEQLPVQAIPAPQHAFAPGSRWHGLERNEDFVGREAALSLLAQALKTAAPTAGPTAVISGSGGVGKTNLASEWVFRYGRFFAGGVFWLACADPHTLDAEIAACGTPACLQLFTEADQLSLDDQVGRVLRVWNQPLPRLIIFDSCEDPALLRMYRNRIGPACRIIATSRVATWPPKQVELVALDAFERAESVQLLQQLCARLSATEAAAIAEELGDLPLALLLAGNYLHAYAYPAQEYVQKLQHSDVLAHPSLHGRGTDRLPTAYGSGFQGSQPRVVARTFALSYEDLDPAQPLDGLALEVLARAACFAPGTPFPRDLLCATLPATVEYADALDALRRVRDLGLLDGDTQLRLHRLVALYIRQAAEPHMHAAQAAVEAQLVAMLKDVQARGQPLELVPLQAHLMLIANQAVARADQAALDLLLLLALLLVQQGSYAQAEALYLEGYGLAQQLFDQQHPELIPVLNNLAELYKLQARYAEAHQRYKQVLRICEHHFEREHFYVLGTLNNLAGLYYAQGDFAAAERLYGTVLHTRQQTTAVDQRDRAVSLNNLAEIYKVQQRYTEAEQLFIEALQIREQLLGPEHSETATTLNNLAALYQAQHSYDQAEALYKHALALKIKSVGDTHPHTAMVINNLADVYEAQQRAAEAEQLRLAALQIYEQVFDADHEAILFSLIALVRMYQAQQRAAEAEPLYQRLLPLAEQQFGPEHPFTFQLLQEQAELYSRQGLYDSAEPLFMRLVSILERVQGPEHVDTANGLSQLARFFFAQKRYAEATPLFERALEIYKHNVGAEHSDLVGPLNNLASVYSVQQRHAEATALFEQALHICSQTLGPDDPLTQQIHTRYLQQTQQADSDQ